MKINPPKTKGLRRRDFLAWTLSSAAVVATGASTSISAASSAAAGTQRKSTLKSEILDTVTGPIDSNVVSWALAHEHLHGDFTGAKNPPMWKALPEGYDLPDYADTDWSVVTGACINAVNEVAAQGVNLIVDYSPAGVGRNVRMLREVSRRTGVHIICASGLYRTVWGIPPELEKFDSDQLARYFVRELTVGVEGTGVRAGFLKLAANNEGPLPHDELVYRAAARAAIETGATIGMHSVTRSGLDAALAILDDEKFDPRRFIWAHAGRDGATNYATLKEIADRGAYISFDGIAYNGVPSDEQVLNFIEQFYNDNLGDKILLSSDSVISAHPPVAQYDMNIRYTYRHFKQKLDDRFGGEVSKQLLRDNVVTAYRRGDRIA